MVPFRVFDQEKKELWIVLNFHPGHGDSGTYLLAREDDSDADGEMRIVRVDDMASLKLVDFLDEAEEPR